MTKYFVLLSLLVLILNTSCNKKISTLSTTPVEAIDTCIFSGIYELDENGQVFSPTNSSTIYTINTNTSISFNEIKKVKKKTRRNSNGSSLSIQLNDEATISFEQLTQDNFKQPLLIIFNNQLIMAPIVQETIKGGNVLLNGVSENLINEILEFTKKTTFKTTQE